MERTSSKLIPKLSYGDEGYEDELRGLCIEALMRIAFGKGNDVLKLTQLSSNELREQVRRLDLFVIRDFEMKETNDKRKLLTVHFYDRMTAIAALLGLLGDKTEKSETFLELCKALTENEKKIKRKAAT